MDTGESRLRNEIEHGRYLVQHGAGEVWNWESPAGKLRWERRVGMLVSYIEPGMKVLELGCGAGYFTKQLALTKAAITAIDISPDLLQIARAGCHESNVTFAIENAYELTFPDGSFDTVVGSSVLHHLDVEKALPEIFRVLKAGGNLYFTEPNMLNPQIAVQKNVSCIKRWLGDSPDETAFFRWNLKQRLAGLGFMDIRVDCFDFLHPKVPSAAIPLVKQAGEFLEKIPVLREFAGSLYIRATKPQINAMPDFS